MRGINCIGYCVFLIVEKMNKLDKLKWWSFPFVTEIIV